MRRSPRARPTRTVRRRVALLGAVALLTTVAAVTTGGPVTAVPSLTGLRTVGGPGSAFLYAWGAATMPDGDILISDYWNFSVKRFTPSGQLVAEYAKDRKGTNVGQHLSPYDLAVDPAGQAFYFGDVDANRTVDKYTFGGQFISEFGGPQRYTYPAYVAVTSDGRVVVADSRSHAISVNTSTGAQLFRFGTQGSGPNQFQTPRGIGICHGCGSGGSDLLAIADSGNARVKVYQLAQGGTTASSATLVRTIGGPGGGQPVPPGSFGPAGNLRGLAIDEDGGWVYVVDAATGFTSKFTLTGTYVTRFGGKGTGEGRFPSGGRGVTVDQQGRVWVSDLGQFRVHVFSSGGQYQFQVPSTPSPPPLGGFNNPSDVAIDEQGNIWVIDTMNQRFQKFSPAGVALQAWGSRGGGTDLSFNYPRAIAVDDTGPGCPTYTCVLVGDTDAGSIVKFDANGNTVWSAGGGGTYKAWSIATAPDGTVFFPDVSRNRVVVLSAGGSLIRTFGSSGTADGRFQRPRGIAYDPSDGTIWVADATRNDIQHFSATGQFLGVIDPSIPVQQLQDVQVNATHVFVADNKTHKISIFTKSGQFVASTPGGGTALGRTLGPMGLAIDGARIYVAEANGNRVQEFRINP